MNFVEVDALILRFCLFICDFMKINIYKLYSDFKYFKYFIFLNLTIIKSIYSGLVGHGCRQGVCNRICQPPCWRKAAMQIGYTQ